MAEEDEGAIGADWAMGAEGAEESEGCMGLQSKMLEWSGVDGVDTP